jgi:hypothetical protein
LPQKFTASRKQSASSHGQDYEDIQDRYEQHDILDDRALKQDVAESRAVSRQKRSVRPDKIKLMKDIGVARKALKKGKVLPPIGGR